MTFEDILDQALAMLQRRGRMTYRTLQRQFHLDDEVLEDLKASIIKAQRLAVDEDGEVLVWTGGAVSPVAPAERKNTRHVCPGASGAHLPGPPASPAGGHAFSHLCTRPQRGAVAPAGAPQRQAERGAARPGQAVQDGRG